MTDLFANLRAQLLSMLKRHHLIFRPFVLIYLFLLLTGRFELAIIQGVWRTVRFFVLLPLKAVYQPLSWIITAFKPPKYRWSWPRILRPRIPVPKLPLPSIRFPKLHLPTPTGVDLISFLLGLVTAISIYVVLILYQWLADLPNPVNLTTTSQEATTKIYDRNGTLLYEIYQDINRTPVKLTEIPDTLKQATIAIEDKDFYTHPGVSLRGISRALYTITLKRKIQGGSTLTQQLVKTVFFSPERTIERKVKEIITALRTEAAFSKDQILEMYLNQISYGGTAYGVAAAADQYFGKKLDQLTLAESALLAGLPAAPTTHSPFGSNKDAYKERQAAVLRRMVEDGYISEAEAHQAANEALVFIQPKTKLKAPHFAMYVREELENRFGREMVAHGGMRVTTTLDLNLQDKIQQIVTEEVDKVSHLDVGNGAALVTKPNTGEILAMVGSRDYYDFAADGQVNVTTSLRQPGSSIKPVTYATAFKKGFTAATTLLDVPTTFSVEGQPGYRPVNYDGKYHGAVQLRFALGNSYNIPAVRTLAAIGVQDMMNTAYELGITTFTDPSRYGLSLTLGGGEVKMTEMAVVSGTFANLGRRQDLVSILEITDTKGHALYQFRPKPGPRVLLPEIAYLISHILLDNSARTAAFGSSSLLQIPGHAVSVKTGTTDDVRDNWTIGYTPSVLVAVWVGNNDNRPMRRNLVSGVTGAAPIWNRSMKEVLKDQPDEWPIKPDGIVGMQICAHSGSAPHDNCPTRYEYFLKGTEPQARSSSSNFTKGKLLVTKAEGKPARTEDVEIEEREVTLASDPLTHNYCVDCGSYLSYVDVAKIPYLPIRFSVEIDNGLAADNP